MLATALSEVVERKRVPLIYVGEERTQDRILQFFGEQKDSPSKPLPTWESCTYRFSANYGSIVDLLL